MLWAWILKTGTWSLCFSAGVPPATRPHGTHHVLPGGTHSVSLQLPAGPSLPLVRKCRLLRLWSGRCLLLAAPGEPRSFQHVSHQPDPPAWSEGAPALLDTASTEKTGDEHCSAARSYQPAGCVAGLWNRGDAEFCTQTALSDITNSSSIRWRKLVFFP